MADGTPNKRVKLGTEAVKLGTEADLQLTWLTDNHKCAVRLEIELSGTDELQHRDDYFPSRATFTDASKKVTSFKILSGMKDVGSEKKLQQYMSEKFSNPIWNITHDFNELQHFLEGAKLRRKCRNTHKSPWTPTGTIGKLAQDSIYRTAWGWLWQAFKTDFGNGEVKYFVQNMCEAIIKVLDKNILVSAPPVASVLNSRVVTADPREFEFESPSSSVYSEVAEGRFGIVASDVLVYHAYEPFFLLTFECTRGSDNDYKAIQQALKQCLSHMHYQSLIFGIVLTPLKWRLLVVQKVGESIVINQAEEPLQEDGDDDTFEFSVNSFINLLNWIYRIIAYQCHTVPTS